MSLVTDADVFLQGYRPGGLRDKGFGVDDVVKARPGIVYASLDAYGWEGPWKDRRGVGFLLLTISGQKIRRLTHGIFSSTRLFRLPQVSTMRRQRLTRRFKARRLTGLL